MESEGGRDGGRERESERKREGGRERERDLRRRVTRRQRRRAHDSDAVSAYNVFPSVEGLLLWHHSCVYTNATAGKRGIPTPIYMYIFIYIYVCMYI